MTMTNERPADLVDPPEALDGPEPADPPAAGAPVGHDDERVAVAYRAPRLPWVLAALGLFGTLAFGLAWNGARNAQPTTTASQGPAAELLSTARSFAEDLTNFDGATIDRDFDRITSQAAGDFRSQADQFFSSDVRKKLKEAQASSRGEIRSAYVQSVDGDRGTVFVVVDQTIANNASPEPQADTLRMELGLVQQDGTWKVDRVSVLTAPGSAASASPAGAADPDATGTGGD